MPQFETTYLISQIFWLLISFGGLYLGVQFLVFPLLKSIFKARQYQVDTILNRAELLTKKVQDLEEKQEQYKQRQEKRYSERLAMTQEKSFKLFQEELTKTEKTLLKSFQTKIQKMEHIEKEILDQSGDFVAKAIKGRL